MKNLIISAIVLSLVSIGCTDKQQDLSINEINNKKMEKKGKEQIEKLLMVVMFFLILLNQLEPIWLSIPTTMIL